LAVIITDVIPRVRRQRIAGIVVVALPIALLALAAWGRRWAAEDAFINFRIIENIVRGEGPVFNPGERVEAGTSPAWLLVLTAGRFLLGEDGVAPFSVLAGLMLTVAGAVLAGAASLKAQVSGAVQIPLGLAIFAGLPPFWDFATSGLETGLTFAWLGACALALTTSGLSSPPRRAAVVLLGLGPLIRPDLALFSLVFIVDQILRHRERRLRTLVLAGALPVAYQVFRMGFFAALVPNTALAKSSLSANPSQGWAYLVDLFDPYALAIPVLIAVTVAALRLSAGPSSLRRPVAIMWIAALLHALYIVRLGGDFMHGRFLLPALFAFIAPVAVLARANTSRCSDAALSWPGACSRPRPSACRTKAPSALAASQTSAATG
jgi:arabinofuranosyltransferase